MTRDDICKNCVYFAEDRSNEFGICMIELPPWLNIDPSYSSNEKMVHLSATCDLFRPKDTEEQK